MSDVVEPTHEVAVSQIKPEDIHLPPNSFWPIFLALGFTCILGGFALSLSLTLVGVVITLVSTIGWVIELVSPEEGH